jgi:hypothetical protein
MESLLQFGAHGVHCVPDHSNHLIGILLALQVQEAPAHDVPMNELFPLVLL